MSNNNKKTWSALLALALLSAGARAEDEAQKPSRKPGLPLKLQVVLSRHQGEKKVASAPYTLSANANGEPTRLRMGIQVPLRYEGKEFPGNVVYKSVGNNLDCSADALDDGRFKVACTIEQSSVYASNGEGKATGSAAADTSLLPPILKNFSSEASLILRDSQTAQYTAATDPVSGEVLKVEVTLNVVK